MSQEFRHLHPGQLSFLDIGVVREVAVDGNDVRVDIVMPALAPLQHRPSIDR